MVVDRFVVGRGNQGLLQLRPNHFFRSYQSGLITSQRQFSVILGGSVGILRCLDNLFAGAQVLEHAA